MKKSAWLIAFLLLSFTSFAQKRQKSIGLVAGANVSTPTLFNGYKREFDDDDNYDWSLFAPSAGVYFNSDLSNRFGFSIAVNYQYWKESFSCPECRDFMTRFYKSQVSLVELPVNLMINLRDKADASWRPYFTLGYTYSRVAKYKFTNLETKEVIAYGISHNGYAWNNHYLNTGFEVRHNFKNSLTLALCPVMRIPLNNETSDFFEVLFWRSGKIRPFIVILVGEFIWIV